MNTRNNRRRKASMEKLEQAFVELLQTRELQEITVSDLCKATGLNRSTFYANYTDIYGLADKIKSDLEREVLSLYSPELIEHSGGGHDYLRLLRHMRDNQLFYKTYFKLGYDDRHPIQAYDTRRAQEEFQNQHIAYHLAFFQAGFNAIVKLWLAGGCKETPEEMDGILRAEYRGRG